MAERRTAPDHQAIQQQLERLLLSKGFAASPQMTAFLRYVVASKLEGTEENIKAYSIAVEALGRPDSFDAQTDPTVRVLATRVRRAIELYYGGHGSGDPIEIRLDKGTYVPQFVTRATSEPGREPEVGRPHRTSNDGPSGRPGRPFPAKLGGAQWAFATCLVLIALGFALWGASRTLLVPGQGAGEPPVIAILRFDAPSTSADDRRVAEGIRQQLVADLSHFRRLRVRSLNTTTYEDGAADGNGAVQYVASGHVSRLGGQYQLSLKLTDQLNKDVVWNRTLRFSLGDAAISELIENSVRQIVAQLASISGLLQADAMKRLESRTRQQIVASGSSYDCMIKFYAYDLRKRPEDGQVAKNCLQRLVDAGTSNSSVWAASALLQFFHWSEMEQSPNNAELDRALDLAETAIRLDPTDSFGYEVKGYVVMHQGNLRISEELFEKAGRLNPSKPNLYVLKGWNKALLGQWAGAENLINQGIALSPSAPGWFRIPLCVDRFRQDRFEDALAQAAEIIRTGDPIGYLLAIAPAYSLGRMRLVQKYKDLYLESAKNVSARPITRITKIFNSKQIVKKYEQIFSSVFAG